MRALVALAAVAASLAVPAQAAIAEAPTAEAPTVTDKSFVVLLRLRYDLFGRFKATGKFPDDDKVANEALAGHGKYWSGLRDSGRAVLAGGMEGDYWDNVALIIFRAPSLEEAERIVAADPAVKAYVFQAQVRPFDIHWPKPQGLTPVKD